MLTRIYIDEAWRWPLAWPLFVGTIMQISDIPKNILLKFKDSKVLSETQRETLFEEIKNLEKENKLLYSIATANEKEIDQYGVTKALNLAISRALFELFKKFYEKSLKSQLQNSQFWKDKIKQIQIENILNKEQIFYQDIKKLKQLLFSPNEDKQAINLQDDWNPGYKLQGVFIDGSTDFDISKDLWIKTTTIIDWDAKVSQISMASIVAKVSRDNFMKNLAQNYPQYWFEHHKWYWNPKHIQQIKKHWIAPVHRKRFLINLATHLQKQSGLTNTEKQIVKEIQNYKNSFSQDLFGLVQKSKHSQVPTKQFSGPILINKKKENLPPSKPKLLLHICCAPDLTRPLRWLKDYFKLYLFWYNPNIHPYQEHQKRYEQYIKLLNLEPGDYEVLEDWYEPQEFFQYLQTQYKNLLWSSPKSSVISDLASMKEKESDRCRWCYELRMLEAAKMAEKYNIPYFTTTLLISPKKDLTHLWEAWIKAQKNIWNRSKFLFFDFKKSWGFEKSAKITQDYGLWRQNYCGCIWSKPK